MTDTDLELGAQARAARYLIDAMDPIDTAVGDLAKAVESSSAGFKGASAAGLAEALVAWFTAASDLTPTLGMYANKLVQVDASAAASDHRAQEAFGRISGRLTGR